MKPEINLSTSAVPEFLTKQEAAKFMACSIRSLDKFRQQDGLKAIKIGSIVRFERSALENFMRAHQTTNSKTDNFKMANGQEGK